MNGKTKRPNVSRRNLLKLSAGAIGTGGLAAGIGSKLVFPEPAVAETATTPDKAL